MTTMGTLGNASTAPDKVWKPVDSGSERSSRAASNRFDRAKAWPRASDETHERLTCPAGERTSRTHRASAGLSSINRISNGSCT